jgi:predicted dehydrogenase
MAVLASRSPESAAAAAAIAGGDVSTDWESAVVRDDVDAVTICTPNDLHEPIAVAAARAGKHVLVEKPMATTLDAADRMIAAADRAGVVLLPAHNVRFAAPFVAAAGAVASGSIGEVTGVRAAFGHAGPQHWAPGSTWFRSAAQAGGGALIDLGVHVADLLRAVLGDEFESVAATTHDDGEVDDDAHVLARFASGAAGTFHASWIARPGPDHQLTVFGTEGTLHLDGRTPLTRFPAAGGEPERVELPASTSNPFEQFVGAIGGAAPTISALDGRAALAAVLAAYEAAACGEFVDVDRGP